MPDSAHCKALVPALARWLLGLGIAATLGRLLNFLETFKDHPRSRPRACTKFSVPECATAW